MMGPLAALAVLLGLASGSTPDGGLLGSFENLPGDGWASGEGMEPRLPELPCLLPRSYRPRNVTQVR